MPAQPRRAPAPPTERGAAAPGRSPRPGGPIAELEELRQELDRSNEELRELLRQPLVLRLGNPSWYLTGVTVGLESLNSFYGISELVYRDYTAHSEGGRRLANIKAAYEQLKEFAHEGQSVETRAEIMLSILLPLQTLLREAKGEHERVQVDAEQEKSQRKTVVGQLAYDISLEIKRYDAFREMAAVMEVLLRPVYLFRPWSRNRLIEAIHHDYSVYRKRFGFGDPAVLRDRKTVRRIADLIRAEAEAVGDTLSVIKNRIYQGRFELMAVGKLHDDLAEEQVLPILHEVFRAAYEYLARAHSVYGHALELIRSDMTLFDRVAELGAMVASRETALARRAAQGV